MVHSISFYSVLSLYVVDKLKEFLDGSNLLFCCDFDISSFIYGPLSIWGVYIFEIDTFYQKFVNKILVLGWALTSHKKIV